MSAYAFPRVKQRDWASSSSQIRVRFVSLPVSDGEGDSQWAIYSNPAVEITVIRGFPSPETHEFKAIPTHFLPPRKIQKQKNLHVL